MSDQQVVNTNTRLPLEVLFTVIRYAVHALPVDEILALRAVNKYFACEADKEIYQMINTRPGTWNLLSHPLRCKYLTGKLGPGQKACHLTIIMDDLEKMNKSEDKDATRTKLLEGIAHAKCNIRSLTSRKRAGINNRWTRSWKHEPVRSVYYILLACSAVYRGDAAELRRVVEESDWDVALMRVDGFKRLGVSMVRLAIERGNKDVLDVLIDFAKRIPAKEVESIVDNIIKSIVGFEKPDLRGEFCQTLSTFLRNKSSDYMFFTSALRRGDVGTIDEYLSRDDFDPAFVPRSGCSANPVVTAMACGKKWYRAALMKTLLDRGFSPNAAHPERNPLKRALEENDLDVISVLLDHGADLPRFDTARVPINGRRWDVVLHAAVILGNSELVEMLLSKGVVPTFEISPGWKFRVEIIDGEKAPLTDILMQVHPMPPVRKELIRESLEKGWFPMYDCRRVQSQIQIVTGVRGAVSNEEILEAMVTYRVVQI
ncbi:hypothetical protein BDW62DRAFT_205956 [Aspergillus aurantiobrunneus]